MKSRSYFGLEIKNLVCVLGSESGVDVNMEGILCFSKVGTKNIEISYIVAGGVGEGAVGRVGRPSQVC